MLVPTYVTEKRTVCSTTYRDEERQRVVTGYKLMPVTEEKIRFTTVMTPQTETKSLAYTSQVAVQTQEEKSYRIKVPVWEDREESYVVKVPVLTEVEENYTVKVPVLKDVEFAYTVNVPYPITRTGTRTVSNVVPVVKTKSIDCCVPVARTANVTVDRGHWENQTSDSSMGRGRRGQQMCAPCLGAQSSHGGDLEDREPATDRRDRIPGVRATLQRSAVRVCLHRVSARASHRHQAGSRLPGRDSHAHADGGRVSR